MTTVYKYTYFCLDEQAFVTSWGIVPPTKCPHDTSHVINTDSISPEIVTTETKVKIENESVPIGAEPTNGFYKCDSVKLDCLPNAVTTVDVQEALPVCIKTINFSATTENRGDCVTITTKPNTLIGLTSSNVSIGQKTFEISPAVLPYIKKGFYFKLATQDNTVKDELDQIITIDAVNFTVTTKNGATHEFSAGSKMMIERRVIDTFCINSGGVYVFGSAVSNSSYVPANTTTRIEYDNKSNESKTFVVYYEYYY